MLPAAPRLYPENAFYLAISPDPNGPGRIRFSDNEGTSWRKCWWIKLGDGDFRGSYGTHNPDVGGVTNMRLPTRDQFVQPIDGPGFPRRNAKALELALFKGPSGSESRSEWYQIWAKKTDKDTHIESEILRIFHEFSTYDNGAILRNLRNLVGECHIVAKHDDVAE